MNSFSNLFSTFSSFFLFLVLEVICFVVIINYNEHQNRVFLTSASRFNGYIAEKTTNVNHYFSLAKEVERLKKANAQLMDEKENALHFIYPKTDSIQYDSVETIQQFDYTPATVINKSYFGNKNYMTISKGSLDGVKVNQGVISDDGVIGIVIAVGTHFSRVMTLLHRTTRISAMIKKNQSFGAIAWQGNDPTIVSLLAIPKHIEIEKGDTIITSGYSSIFPADLPIGKIEAFKVKKGDNNYKIKVKLFNDLTTVKNVYVIDNLLIEELQNLEKDE